MNEYNKAPSHLDNFADFGPCACVSQRSFASGAGETLEAEVKGYHVSLSFVDEIKTGENEVHVQIVDSQDRSVTPTEVEISVIPITEAGHQATASDSAHGAEPATEHGTDTNSTSGHVVPTSGHENMSGMDPDAEAIPESSHDMESGPHEEMIMVTLEPEIETSEYKGILNFERSGDWSLIVHFSVEGQFLEVEIPVSVAGLISRYNILACWNLRFEHCYRFNGWCNQAEV